MAGSPNDAVAAAVDQIRITDPDRPVQIPAGLRALLDRVLDQKHASEKPALLFLLSYKLLNPHWDLRRVPTGWRPADKILCGLLTELSLTLHGNITAYGENLGIKGGADKYDLFDRPLLGGALKALADEPSMIRLAFEYVAWRFRASFREPLRIEPLSPDELTYTKALTKADNLLLTESGGHLPQFLVAALLRAFHSQWKTGLHIVTHHPHASDTSDRVAGDVEVQRPDGRVVEAYEVTVRPDWKNRRQDLLKKMQKHGLGRYHVLCLIPERDGELATPEALHNYMSPLGQDISVVDIRAFVADQLMGLTRDMRAAAFAYLEAFIRDPKLCGVPELERKLKQILEG